jgi:hypothetical protein
MVAILGLVDVGLNFSHVQKLIVVVTKVTAHGPLATWSLVGIIFPAALAYTRS